MEQAIPYEVKIGRTTFIVSHRFSGTQSLEDVLKQAIKRRIESEALEKRFEVRPPEKLKNADIV